MLRDYGSACVRYIPSWLVRARQCWSVVPNGIPLVVHRKELGTGSQFVLRASRLLPPSEARTDLSSRGDHRKQHSILKSDEIQKNLPARSTVGGGTRGVRTQSQASHPYVISCKLNYPDGKNLHPPPTQPQTSAPKTLNPEALLRTFRLHERPPGHSHLPHHHPTVLVPPPYVTPAAHTIPF